MLENKNAACLEVFAHRGASGRHFENTMEAFIGALEEGADGIELDVQLSKDGVFFVIHDNELSRLAGIEKTVSEIDAADLQQLVIGKKFFRKFGSLAIPTLASVISFASLHSMSLNVELKETISERPECLSTLLEQLSVLDSVHVSSFDYSLLEMVKQLNPQLEVALLLRKSMLSNRDLADYPAADAYHFHKRLMKNPYLSLWEQTDKKIRVYGVDGTEPFVQKPPSFINGWITDYPSRFTC